MSDTKKILITGGCGFIGSNLTQFVLENTDWNISILDNLSTGSKDHISDLEASRIDLIIGDIRKRSDVEKAIRNCTYVVNLAAQCGVPNSLEKPFFDMQVNVVGVLNLLVLSVENNVEKFIQASSAAVLGDQDMPIDENKLPSPLSPYGASKLAGEAYCSAFSGSFNLNTIILRFSNVYGPMSDSKTSVIATFIQRILNNKSIIMYGDGTQTRDFIHVGDISNGIYRSLIKDLETSFNTFQLGSGIETSILDIYKLLSKILGKKITIDFKEKRAGDIYRNYSNIKHAQDLIDFRPRIELEEGLSDLIDWFRKIFNYK